MKISVLFSTRNRAVILRHTLVAMCFMDVADLDFEIIGVDNGSNDETPEVLKEFQERLPIKSFIEPIPGKNRCLNRAVGLSKGDLLVFTDDDVVPRTDWLIQYRDATARWPDDSVFGGKITLSFPEDTPSWIRKMKRPYSTYAFSDFDPGVRDGPMDRSPTGPNMAVRRQVFDQFRFDETVGPAGNNYAMGSETELLCRLHHNGYRFIFVPNAHVEHIIREEQVTLRWLQGRAFRLGRGGGRGRDKYFKVAGVSWRVWVWLLIALPLYFGTLPMPDKYRFFSVWQLNRALGYLHERGFKYWKTMTSEKR